MEDAATAEISRAQVWQWIRHPRGALSDGRKVTKELFRSVLEEELDENQNADRRANVLQNGKFESAELFDRITTDDEFARIPYLAGLRDAFWTDSQRQASAMEEIKMRDFERLRRGIEPATGKARGSSATIR